MVLYLVVVFCLLFVVSDCRMTFKLGFTKPAPQCFSVYGVESGDTCFAIRQEFNLTAAEFGAVNPNLECDKLFPVGFAKPASAPQCFSVYGVESGNTCFAIRQELNLTAAEFGAINPNLECDKLFPGQWLCVVGRV
ncbi:hypothetical protein QJS10_CPB11g01013 [Acorus calamus]|uniref:LysM domain-containing protein n=1 Tax=Acorus calamus TaxID=4465 RepID=A0AAV9DRU2_ACOCL|nr:hypothetical protein QJS10_CPB11g01013 [Acorus calamus]